MAFIKAFSLYVDPRILIIVYTALGRNNLSLAAHLDKVARDWRVLLVAHNTFRKMLLLILK